MKKLSYFSSFSALVFITACAGATTVPSQTISSSSWYLYTLGQPTPRTNTGVLSSREADGEDLAYYGGSFWAVAKSSGALDNLTGSATSAAFSDYRLDDLFSWTFTRSGSGSTGTLVKGTPWQLDMLSGCDDDGANRDFGLGGITASSTGQYASYRIDNGTGTPHLIGWLDPTASLGLLGYRLGYPSGSTLPISNIITTQGGTGYSDTLTVPATPEPNGNVAYVTFGNQILYYPAGTASAGGQWGAASPLTVPSSVTVHGASQSFQTTGILSYNSHYGSGAGLYALLAFDKAGSKTDAFYVFQIVNTGFGYQIQSLSGAANSVTEVDMPTGRTASNTTGRVSYDGQPMIAINDNGDVAMTTTDGTNKYVEVYTLSGSTYTQHTALTINNSLIKITGTTSLAAVSSPALDNSDNVYFAAPLSTPAGGSSDVIHNAIYKGTLSGSTWTASPIVSHGATLGGGKTVAYIPTQDLPPYWNGSALVQAQTQSSAKNVSPAAIGPNSLVYDGTNVELIVSLVTNAGGGTTGSINYEYDLLTAN